MYRIIFILFLAFSISFIGCSSQNGTTTTTATTATAETETKIEASVEKSSHLLSPADFQTKLQSTPNAQLVDVRTPEEFSSGYIANAVLIDYKGSDFKNKIAELNMEDPVFVYCAVGGRSGRAAKMLADMGFKEVYDLDGGMGAWLEKGLEVDKP